MTNYLPCRIILLGEIRLQGATSADFDQFDGEKQSRLNKCLDKNGVDLGLEIPF